MGKTAKPESGYAKFKRSGKRAIMIGLHRPDYTVLREAARLEGRPVAQYVAFHALVAARKAVGRRVDII